MTKLNDFYEDSNFIYIVMDLMLSDMRDLMIEVNAPIKEADAKSIFYHMVSSVHHIHRNQVIHRDIKLENFLVDEDKHDKQIIIKLIDFGLACVYDPNNKPTQKCGTLVTVAPEIFTDKYYDYKVDCWALGVVLFELLSNDLPFFHKDAKLFKKQILSKPIVLENYPALRNISPEAKDLLLRLLQKDPTKRISTK